MSHMVPYALRRFNDFDISCVSSGDPPLATRDYVILIVHSR